MQILHSSNEQEWEAFLRAQPWSPFLQSWTMGEVYRAVGQEPVRLELRSGSLDTRRSSVTPNSSERIEGRIEGQSGATRDDILGICQAIVVPAKRGKHLSVPYGPVLGLRTEDVGQGMTLLIEELRKVAKEHDCAFIRMSPFWARSAHPEWNEAESKGGAVVARHGLTGLTTDALPLLMNLGFRLSPLHLLAEHIWFLDLRGKAEEDIQRGMRQTTRNLVRRAERESVTVEVSDDPVRDLSLFLTLHEETRKRHRFTPYTDAFFRAQVEKFSEKKECALYLARYRGEVIAASIHMIYGGETSYHHGASSHKFGKIPASYLLQWRAIQDAMRRGDRVYNFWGVAPLQGSGNSKSQGSKFQTNSKRQIPNSKHPFAGVTMFKTGFGGELLELVHCMDLPLSRRYWVTYGIETVRKWRRGF